MANMIELMVFETKASEEKLRELIEGLNSRPTYGSEGVSIHKTYEKPHLYTIDFNHGGWGAPPNLTVRVVDSQIWAKKASGMIECALRSNGIGYESGVVEMTRYKSIRKGVNPVSLEDKVEFIYQPLKK